MWGASHSPMGLGLDNWRAMAGSPTTLSCSNSNEGRSDAQDRRQRQAASGECWAAVKVPATKYLGACAHAAWSHSVRGGVPPTFCNESTTATQTHELYVKTLDLLQHVDLSQFLIICEQHPGADFYPQPANSYLQLQLQRRSCRVHHVDMQQTETSKSVKCSVDRAKNKTPVDRAKYKTQVGHNCLQHRWVVQSTTS